MTAAAATRLNIYLDDEDLRTRIKIAAAQDGVTLSAYCVAAIRDRLAAEGRLPERASGGPETPAEAARILDRIRNRIGPIGVPVSELIREGRRR